MLRLSALRESMLLLILVVIWLFFYVATNGIFLTPRNLVLLALQTSIVSLAAISAVMLIVTRNFDLSVGSAVALVGVVVALLAGQHNVSLSLALMAGIAAGLLMGAWQGFWVTRIGVSSFIVTLAGMLYFRGFSMIVTNGATIASLPRPLTRFATAFFPAIPSIILVIVTGVVFLVARWLEIRALISWAWWKNRDRLSPKPQSRSSSLFARRCSWCRGRAFPISFCWSRSARSRPSW